VVHSEMSEVDVNVIMEYRDVTFFESIFAMRDKEVVALDGPSRTYSLPSSVHDQIPDLELRRSKTQRTEKSLGDDYIIYLVDEEPRSLTEAYTSPDAEYWREAVRSEMDSIISNETWEITDLQLVASLWAANGSLGGRGDPMVLLKSTRPILWLRVLLKRKRRIILILILRWLGCPQSVCY
jgi:hypothetical protein